jgi:calmodulin
MGNGQHSTTQHTHQKNKSKNHATTRATHTHHTHTMADERTLKDAFALFDKSASGAVSSAVLGDMLRAVGQNPTLKEISNLQDSLSSNEIDYESFKSIVNRDGGFKSLGKPEDYVKAFQIFDKNLTGFISVGELKYILTTIGEKLTNEEVDELLKNVTITEDKSVDYAEFVKSILSQ